MNKKRKPKIILDYRPYGRRRLGRPLKRLLNEAETGLSRPNSLRKMMTVKLDVHGSVHHNINRIEITNKMGPCSRIYYSSVI
jgi:hypothetical protein